MNLTQKIIGSHLVSGTMTPGSEIGLRIDQTLTQDATGTMAWLQFEALGIPRVKTDISLSYVDHNTLQMNFRNPDDHRFLRTVERFPDREYVVDDRGNRHTYSQVDVLSSRIASYLKDMGIKPGDCVSFQVPVWSEFAVIAMGCLKHCLVSRQGL